jgi:anti-sigma factor RsiW
MTECRASQPLLPQYVADGMPTTCEYAAVRAHLASCPHCRITVERLVQVETSLSRWPLQQAPPDMAERILAAIDREAPIEAWNMLPWNVWLPALTLLVALALAIHLTPAMQAGLITAPWIEPGKMAPLPLQFSRDPAFLWALWIGFSIAVSGMGITLALVHGRLPDEEEIDHLRDRLSDTAHRLRRLAGQ